ncbi:MAG: TonB-dependent receptor [Cyanobacteria bacterium]|nr:TonB-dependent receptor [Cyanobacteria bacterium GSL.Bin1]
MKQLLQNPTKVACLATLTYSLLLLYSPTKAVAVNEPSAKNAKETNKNLAQSTTEVTGVQLQETEEGLTLFLETSTGREPQTFRTTYGETLVIDLTNSRLRLPEGETFQQQNPAPGIALVEVEQRYSNTVRVRLVGETEVPTAEINATEQGVALAVNSEAIAQEPAEETPPAPTPPSTEQPQEQEPIELVVTATRTEERQIDIPRSVTVIEREEIEQQSRITNNISDILGKTLPGFAPPNQSINSVNTQSLRGRGFTVLIDGVPQSTNQGFASPLRTIAPSAVEKIEVVRGPTAIYGGNASGGVINIITRSSTGLPFSANSKVGFRGSLSNFLESDSLGLTLEQTLSGDLGDVDYLITSSFEDIGAFFDAEGDRVPKSAFSDFASLASEANTLNIMGKLGWDISPDQRLQLTVSHLDQDNTSDFVGDTNISEDEKARAVEVEGGLEFEEDPGTSNTVLNLSYNNDDLLGSEVDAQLFYRNVKTRTGTGSLSLPDQEIGSRPIPFQSTNDLERWGGRLGIETPLAQEDQLNLFWGVDYDRQGDINQDLNILEDTNPGPGINFEEVFTPTADDTPVAKIGSFGAFAQLAWEVTEDWNLRGGLRFENVTVANNDFRPLNSDVLFEGSRDPDEFLGELISASERSFNDTVFNIGTTVDVTDNLNAFASFAQGFQIPDFRRALRGGLSVDEDLDRLQPQVIDQYEIGLRGNWDRVQASIAGFYTTSDLGIGLERDPETGFLRQFRAPKRTWGLEAQVDWQPSDNWQLGSIVSWNEGEVDRNDDGEFLRLGLRDIQPMKVTAYVENQTTPGWRNRLQMLWVAGREVDNEIASFDTDSYVVFDLISDIDVGPGQLQLAIENIFNNQFIVFDRQTEDNDGFGVRAAAPGTTLTVNYSFDW